MFALQHHIQCRLLTAVGAYLVFQFSSPLETAVTNKNHVPRHWRLTAMAHWGVKFFEFEHVLTKTPMPRQKLGDLVVQCTESP